MSAADGFLSRLVAALAARPAATTTSVPLPTSTRLAAALAARPVVGGPGARAGQVTAADVRAVAGDKLTGQVKLVVANFLGTTVDQLRLDSDGDIGIRAGSAMILVRAQEEPPLVDVFSPLLTGVAPTETLYRRLSELTTTLPFGRIYCSGDTVWASIPVFGVEFQPTHLLVAIRAMLKLADDLDDQLRQEFGGSRAFGPESPGIEAVPDPTGYLRDRAAAGESPAGRILVDLLADRGHLDQLRVLAETGDWHAASRLATLLHEQGAVGEAERFWRLAADQGEPAARTALATVLADRGDVDEAVRLLQAGVAVDDWHGVGLLVTLLARQGRLDEAVELLRDRAS
ncbi:MULTISPECIES: T3SS (YopN, CesT) and YbjN peptide-binding chaperone 1 [unclassified Solwaraspora]|uniref:T3SS (YopN, CesT) and YbjN peptide-binding chaperone 1 n=1 Tax=unclassified Solwaraspora TaxID=2627926 RepID=UPI00338EEE4C